MATENKYDQLFVSIDIGTVYSSIAYYRLDTKTPQCFVVNFGEIAKYTSRVPTCVGWAETKRKNHFNIVVGSNAAKSRSIVSDGSFKRIIGLSAGKVTERPLAPEMVEDGDELLIHTTDPRTSDTVQFSPTELYAVMAHSLLEGLNKDPKKFSIGQVVVTVPAKFTAAQKKAVHDALVVAGISERKVHVVSDHTAVLKALKLNTNFGMSEGVVTVVDLGEMVDVTQCRLEEPGKLLYAACNNQHTGTMFSESLKKLITNKVNDAFNKGVIAFNKNGDKPTQYMDYTSFLGDAMLKTGRATLPQRSVFLARQKKLNDEVERVKVKLSQAEKCDIDLKLLFDMSKQGEVVSELDVIPISRVEVEAEWRQPLASLRDSLNELVNGNGTEASSSIILVGGLSNIPSVQQMVKELFHGKVYIPTEPELAVVKGAAILAYEMQDNIVKLTQCPCTVGLGNDILSLICAIPFGVELPYSNDLVVEADGTTPTVSIDLYRYDGEYNKGLIKDKCHPITVIGIPNVPVGKKSKITLLFEVDKGGKLTYTATVGESKIVLKDSVILESVPEKILQIREHINNHSYNIRPLYKA